MERRNPCIFRRFRTLSIAMGVYTPDLYLPLSLAAHERTYCAILRTNCSLSPLFVTLAFFMGGGGRGVSALLNNRNNIARDVRISWQDSNRAYERLSVTQQLREQASLALDLAQARYNLGLGSIVEFSQAELQKTEADIADTDAKYQYRLTQIVLAYTMAAPK
jgi:hypothetical protein